MKNATENIRAGSSAGRRDFMFGIAGAGIVCALGGCAVPRPSGRPKFALNASTLRGYGINLLDQVKAAAAAGFAGFEPWMKDIRAAKDAGILGDVSRAARDCGLEFVNGIAFGQWTSPDPKVRAEGIEETKRDMALLAEIGCPRVAASMFGVQRPGSPILKLDEIAERYAAVLDLGRQTGVRPLLEYWGHSVNLSRLEDALEVLGMLGRPDAAVLADVYHTYRGGGSFDAFRRLSSSTLPVLHVNDFPASPPRERLVDADRVWPGDGIAPWRDIFAALDAANAAPWLSIEVFNPAYWKSTPSETASEGFGRLKRTYEANRP